MQQQQKNIQPLSTSKLYSSQACSNNVTTEAWVPLQGFEDDYRISLTGKVKSVDRLVISKAGVCQPKYGKPLILRTNKVEKHLFFEVCKSIDGVKKRKTFYIHKVVAQQFLPAPSAAHIYVSHIDGDYNNNHVNNLKWITHKELMGLQPNRALHPTKAWETRKANYGNSGCRSKIKS